MDPFSIVAASAATLGLLNKLHSTVARVFEIWDGVQKVELLVEDLDGDLNHLQLLVSFIRSTVNNTPDVVNDPSPSSPNTMNTLDTMLQSTCRTFDSLERIFVDVTRQRNILPSIRQYYRYEQYKGEISSLRARIGVYVSSLSCVATLLAPRQSSADLSGLSTAVNSGLRKLEASIEKLDFQISHIAEAASVNMWLPQWNITPSLGNNVPSQSKSPAAQARGDNQAPQWSRNGESGAGAARPWNAALLEEDTTVKRLAENFAATVRQTASTVSSLHPKGNMTGPGTSHDAWTATPPSSTPATTPNRNEQWPLSAMPIKPKQPPQPRAATVGDTTGDVQDIMAHLSVYPLEMSKERRDGISDWATGVGGTPPSTGVVVEALTTSRDDISSGSTDNASGTGTQTTPATSVHSTPRTFVSTPPSTRSVQPRAETLKLEMWTLTQRAHMLMMGCEYENALKALVHFVDKLDTEDYTALEMIGTAIIHLHPFGGKYDREIGGYPKVVARVLQSRYELASQLFDKNFFTAAIHVLDACCRVRSATPVTRESAEWRTRGPVTSEDHKYSLRFQQGLLGDSSSQPKPLYPDPFTGQSPSGQSGQISALLDRPRYDCLSYQVNRAGSPLPGVSAAVQATSQRATQRPSQTHGRISNTAGMGWQELYCLPLWGEIYLLLARAWMEINPGCVGMLESIEKLLGMHREQANLDVELRAKHLLAEAHFANSEFASAKKMAKEAIQGRKELLGLQHIETQRSIAVLLAICQETDDNEEMYWRDQTQFTYKKQETTSSSQQFDRFQLEVQALFETNKAMAVDLTEAYLKEEYDLEDDLSCIRRAVSSGNGKIWNPIVRQDSAVTWPALTLFMQSNCTEVLDVLVRRLMEDETCRDLFLNQGGLRSALQQSILSGRTGDVLVLLQHGNIGPEDFSRLVCDTIKGIRPVYAYPDVSLEFQGVQFEMEDDEFVRHNAQLSSLEEVVKTAPPHGLRLIINMLLTPETRTYKPAILAHPGILRLLVEYVDNPEECVNMMLPRTSTVRDGAGPSPWKPISSPLLHHAISHTLGLAAGLDEESPLLAGPLQCIDLLLDYGADPDLEDERGLVAAQVAVEEAHRAEENLAIVRDILRLILGEIDVADPDLKLHKLYRGSSADFSKELVPKGSRFSRMLKRISKS
ncbi:hypothetical protein GGR54DRAFT_13555 [Hypoxylon sp. NC1633]|nr:hypothetical protein GGR54DRAFT_13555 [Hypoxylon sp. NC1633]